jgi:hypothetical protein
MQLAGIQAFRDEIDAERRFAVPGPFLAGAVKPNRHIALIFFDNVIAGMDEAAQSGGRGIGDQYVAD